MSTRLAFVGFYTLVVALLVGVQGCTGAKRTTASSSRVETTSTASATESGHEQEEAREAEEEEIDREANKAMEKALERALEHGWTEIHLLSECGFDSGWRSLELFTGGIGVLDSKVQFSIERGQVESILEEFKRVGFAEMPKAFGGSGEPDEEFALRVICRISLKLDGVGKDVLQFDKGKQSEELRGLASFLLKTSEPLAARSGESATDLHDALVKVAQGQLAAETLDLTANHKPGVEDLKAGARGWVLHVAGGSATARAYLPDGLGENLELRLSSDQIRQLASVLSDTDFDGLPGNLFSERYTDLAVRVLRWKKDVQARDFAGMSPESQTESRERFQSALAAATKIAERVLREGKPSIE